MFDRAFEHICTNEEMWWNEIHIHVSFWVYQNDRLKQGIHRHQTPPRYRNASPFAIRSITVKRDVIHKPEVHNVAQRHPRRTEPRPWDPHKKFREDRSSASRDMLADRHTQRDKLSVILYSAPRGGVINSFVREPLNDTVQTLFEFSIGETMLLGGAALDEKFISKEDYGWLETPTLNRRRANTCGSYPLVQLWV